MLSLLTMNRKYKLRVELEDFTGEKRYAEYLIFSVKPETDKYQLIARGYSGNAGRPGYLCSAPFDTHVFCSSSLLLENL